MTTTATSSRSPTSGNDRGLWARICRRSTARQVGPDAGTGRRRGRGLRRSARAMVLGCIVTRAAASSSARRTWRGSTGWWPGVWGPDPYEASAVDWRFSISHDIVFPQSHRAVIKLAALCKAPCRMTLSSY
jgi:hypothetical protein